MTIQEAINKNLVLIAETKEDLERLAPFFRTPLTSEDIREKEKELPIDCYATPTLNGLGFHLMDGLGSGDVFVKDLDL